MITVMCKTLFAANDPKAAQDQYISEQITCLDNSDPDDLYLIYRRDHKDIHPQASWGEVLFFENNTALVKADRPPLIDYPSSVYQILRVDKHLKEKLTRDIEPETEFLNYDPAVLSVPEVTMMASALQSDGLYDSISHLENYKTRFFLHPNRYQITSWLSDQFYSYGFTDVEIDSFYIDEYVWGDFPEVWQSNVIAIMEGNTYPDHLIMIGAHYDSIISPQFGDPMEVAPGADDNASGVAALLEIAQVLQKNDYSPRKSLMFIAFGAEEIGLKGSRYYSEALPDTDYRLELMLNNDMIAYTKPDDDKWKVKLFPYRGFAYLAELAENVFTDHTVLEPVMSQYNNPASDSFPFYEQGLPTLFFHEYHFNPYYHSLDDMLINCNVDYALEITKASLLSMLYLDKIPVRVEEQKFIDTGDGSAVIAAWSYPVPEEISHYNIYFGTMQGEYTDFFSTSETEYYLPHLEEGNDYYVGIAAVNKDGFEGVISERKAIPSSVPQTPQNFRVSSQRDHVVLSWQANSELDLAGYNIYRSKEHSYTETELYASSHPDTIFIDYALQDMKYYYYSVTAIDEAGNESPPTEEIKTRLFSLNRGILLVNATPEGSGAFLLPESEELFRYYDFLLSNYPVTYLPLNDTDLLSVLDIAPYSTMILFNDSIRKPSYLPHLSGIMSKYLDKGGNLLLAGLNPVYHFSGNDKYPQDFAVDSFVNQYLGIDSAHHSTGSFFHTATSLTAGYPDKIETDINKTHAAIDHHLINVTGLKKTSEATEIYRYNSLYPDHTTAGALQNAIAGVENKQGTSAAITLSFPLFYMNENDVSALLNHILQEVFAEEFWQIEPVTGEKQEVYVLPNYPNPFRQETVIAYYLENSGSITVEIYNIKGQIIRTLYRGESDSGKNKMTWNGRDENDRQVASGVYLCTVKQGNKLSSRKILLIR